MTGYRAFSYQFVKTFPVLSRGFEIETEMSIHAVDKNMLVDNVIIEYRDRPDGSESKLNTYTDGMKVLFTIIKLFKGYRPFQFFWKYGILAYDYCGRIIYTRIYDISSYRSGTEFPNFDRKWIYSTCSVAGILFWIDFKYDCTKNSKISNLNYS